MFTPNIGKMAENYVKKVEIRTLLKSIMETR